MDIQNINPNTITVAALLFVGLVFILTTGAKKLWVFGWTHAQAISIYEKIIDGLTADLAESQDKNDKHDQLLEDKFLPALLDSTHLLQEIHESYEKEAIRAAIDRENRDRS